MDLDRDPDLVILRDLGLIPPDYEGRIERELKRQYPKGTPWLLMVWAEEGIGIEVTISHDPARDCKVARILKGLFPELEFEAGGVGSGGQKVFWADLP